MDEQIWLTYRVNGRPQPTTVSLDAEEASGIPLGDLAPIRRPQSYRGQMSKPGFAYWTPTGRHLLVESRLELSVALALDHEHRWVGASSQPLRISWTDVGTGRPRRHTPDFGLVDRHGLRCLVDVSSDRALDHARRQEGFAVARKVCAHLGWAYRVDTGPSPAHLANLRLLAMHRAPNHVLDKVLDAVAASAARPRALADVIHDLVDASGTDPALARSAVLRALWTGHLNADLSETLHDATPVIGRLPGLTC